MKYHIISFLALATALSSGQLEAARLQKEAKIAAAARTWAHLPQKLATYNKAPNEALRAEIIRDYDSLEGTPSGMKAEKSLGTTVEALRAQPAPRQQQVQVQQQQQQQVQQQVQQQPNEELVNARAQIAQLRTALNNYINARDNNLAGNVQAQRLQALRDRIAAVTASDAIINAVEGGQALLVQARALVAAPPVPLVPQEQPQPQEPKEKADKGEAAAGSGQPKTGPMTVEDQNRLQTAFDTWDNATPQQIGAAREALAKVWTELQNTTRTPAQETLAGLVRDALQ